MHQHEIGAGAEERLASDLRTFSPAGIERVGWGWRQHQGQAEAFQAAELAALHAIEQADRGPAWEVLRRRLRGLMEGSDALLSWKEEHGHESHTAERAVYGAALALLAGDRLPHEQYVALVGPLAEALPWLLPETPPAPRRG
ncbi:MAG TPA: hypothetical protein VGL99_32125 [Chloroflexota bacterium]